MIHAQYQSTGGTGTGGVQRQGAWQVAVARGRYDVEVTVGEASPGSDPTRNVVNLEGTNAIDYTTVTGGGSCADRCGPLQDRDHQRAGRPTAS